MTTNNPTLQLLMETRDLISKKEHWTQNAFAKNELGVIVHHTSETAHSFCIVGALNRVTDKRFGIQANTATEAAWKLVADAMPGLQSGLKSGLTVFNDKHTHEEVIAVLNKAIDLAKEAAPT